MDDNRYLSSGWIAIAAAALTLPMVVLGVALDIMFRRDSGAAAVFLVPYLAVSLAQTACGLYVLARLKTLLNERHGFHDVDRLVVGIILAACLLTLIALIGRVSLVLGAPVEATAIFFVALLVVGGIPLSILIIVFGIKLLRLDSDLSGLLKPFAYVTIGGAACMMTFILTPVGLLLEAAANVILGLIFLRQASGQQTPDFV